PERSVILSETPPLPSSNDPFSSFQGTAQITDSQINQVRLHAQSTSSAILVVSQIYYPGWKATVDGHEVPVMPADLALTGIPLTAGTHEVQLSFQPTSFKIGASITVATIVLIIGLIVVGARPTAVHAAMRNVIQR